MNEIEYRFTVRPMTAEEGGGYLIEFPDLPGCMSDGETIEEAIANGAEAKRDWIAAMRQAGRALPPPTVEATETYSGKWVVRMPKSLHRGLVERAREEGVSLNTLAVTMMAQGLEHGLAPDGKRGDWVRNAERGQQSGKREQMLKTTYVGKELLHRHLWTIVEEEAKLAGDRERGWYNPSLVAMVFAFHTVEAYLNFVGEQLAPEIWKDERNYFRKVPYRGWDGKLRKVMELVGLPFSPNDDQLKTILALKAVRDLIAHGKPEKMAGEVVHSADTTSSLPVSTLRSLVAPKQRLTTILPNVEQFLNQIHALAATKVDDIWFGAEALRGPLTYSSGQTRQYESAP